MDNTGYPNKKSPGKCRGIHCGDFLAEHVAQFFQTFLAIAAVLDLLAEQFQAPLLGRTVNMCAECKADYDELRELFGY